MDFIIYRQNIYNDIFNHYHLMKSAGHLGCSDQAGLTHAFQSGWVDWTWILCDGLVYIARMTRAFSIQPLIHQHTT